MRQFIVWCLLGLSLYSNSGKAFDSGDLADERFPNLRCQEVNKGLDGDRLLSYFSRNQIDGASLHIPVANWGFSVGLYDLANCWSLSRFQRLAYFLGRPHQLSDATSVQKTLDMTRLFLPEIREEGDGFGNRIVNRYHPSWALFPWSYRFFAQLWGGYAQELSDGSAFHRDFKHDIELYQNYRFHNLIYNFPYILADNARPTWVNRKTITRLKTNLTQNALPLILIRPVLWSQHVVLAKRFQILNPDWVRIWVYDSNYPRIENYMDYNVQTSEFYAPEIIRGLAYVRDPWKPVGVFIIDEGERRDVLNFLVKYFKQRCQSWAKNSSEPKISSTY
jgi:hypothetical protein